MTSRGTSLKLVIGALVTSALATLVGCGGSDDGTPPPLATSTPTTQSTPAATPTAPPVGAGLDFKIGSAQIADDPAGEISINFSLTDTAGNPLKPVPATTQDPQSARVRFTIAHVDTYSGGGDLNTQFKRYVNDVNRTTPAYDSMGTFVTVDGSKGLYRYVFNKHLAAGYSRTTTYAVGAQVNRGAFQGQVYTANTVFDFIPNGDTNVEVLAGSTTAQCNQCHDPLTAHGSRREFRLCTTCHTQEANDEGTPIAFRVMIHKIHRGVDLPSIVDGPPGSSYGIGNATFAEKHDDGSITGVAFPGPINDCEKCHANGPTSSNYLTAPAAAACASCHDDVNPSLETTSAGPPGTKHFQNKGFADGDCTFCHEPEQKQEFDVTIPGAHVIPERSAQLKGINIDITDVSNAGPGQAPTVDFIVTDNSGAVTRDLSGFNRVGFSLAGPTTDYAALFTPTAFGGGATGTLTGPAEDGTFSYTLASPIPADATGTWTVGAEARRSVNLVAPEGKTVAVNEAAPNPVVSFSVTDPEPEPRRVVVEDANCQKCHGEFSKGFSIHGNLRNRVEYCVTCHSPNQNDSARRKRDAAAVAAGASNSPIDFKVMIHKIHTGEELDQKPYLIYGFGPAPANYSIVDFSDVLYPGDRRHCATCHVEDSFLLPPYPGDALPTLLTHLDPATGNNIIDGHLGPITAVCTACHDSDSAMAHAATQTAPSGEEACAVCHSEGRAAPVSVVHAR